MFNKREIYQIYYQGISLNSLDRGFIPLDNSMSSGDGWFEFTPIYNYVKKDLKNDTWYGFLSPRFFEKTGYDSNSVDKLIKSAEIENKDVLLISTAWDQICYFKNPVEQAEYWHRGIKPHLNKFIAHNTNINSEQWYSNLSNTVYSNYIIAKNNFWKKWKDLADKFLIYKSNNNEILNQRINYRNNSEAFSYKVFMQERLASMVLFENSFNVFIPNYEFEYSIDNNIFANNFETRRNLIISNYLKKLYNDTRDINYIKAYEEIKKKIILKIN